MYALTWMTAFLVPLRQRAMPVEWAVQQILESVSVCSSVKKGDIAEGLYASNPAVTLPTELCVRMQMLEPARPGMVSMLPF